MKKTFCLLIQMTCVCLFYLTACAHAQVYRTVSSLWAGYDPEALPLNTQVVQKSEEDGIVLEKLYYTSEIYKGFPVRIISYFAFPKSGHHLPALLHIHGGGQTATKEYVEYWAKRGYAAISIDWGGYPLEHNPAEGNTNWGPLQAEQKNKTVTYRVIPNTRGNAWFHWAIACRRAITFLELQPQVDKSRIGIFGVSMGGRLTWIVAGIDPRVKAAIAVYGAVDMSEPLPGLPGSEQLKLTPEEAAIWKGALDASAYAPLIRCPFLFLGATDDFYGNMDFVNQALKRIPGQNRWQAYSLHFSHHVAPEQAADMPLFMDRWLKGGKPWPKPSSTSVQLGTSDHVPTASVTPEQADDVARVSIYYSLDPYPQSRFWRSADTEEIGRSWRANLPLTVTNQGLYVFANVFYDSGLCLSTPEVFISSEQLARSGVKADDPHTDFIDDLQHSTRDWFVPSSPNPIIGDKPLALDRQGSYWRIATRKVGDPKWTPPPHAGLEIRISAAESNTLFVVLVENELRRGKNEHTYVAEIPVVGGARWQTLRIPISHLHLIGDRSPTTSWAGVNLLSLQSQYKGRVDTGETRNHVTFGLPWRGAPPQIGVVRWIVPSQHGP